MISISAATDYSWIFFEHVGVAVVENCFAGFSSSLFAYGHVSSHLPPLTFSF